MADLAHEAPKINWDDLTQIPALPLGSWLKTDPWDDHVHMLDAKRYAPMNRARQDAVRSDAGLLQAAAVQRGEYATFDWHGSGSARGRQNNTAAPGGQQAPEAAPQGTPGQPPATSATQPANQDTAAQQQTPTTPQ